METSASVVRPQPDLWRRVPLGSGAAIARSARERPTTARRWADDSGSAGQALSWSGLALLAASIAGRAEPVFVISDCGRLIIRNAAADELLSAGALVLSGARLRIAVAGATLDQRWLERTAAAAGAAVEGLMSLRFQIPTRPTEARMFATAQRLDADVWMITVHLTSGRHPPCTARLKQLLGLTPAESRLVAELFMTAGRLDDVAAARGITHETARSQLRSVFQKCNVSSQAELVRLVAFGPFF